MSTDPGGMPMLVTLEALARAIEARTRAPRDAANAEAEVVLEIFGFDDEVVDNRLDPADRQLFYALERAGLLTTRSEETTLWNGQEWRTHYWTLRGERIAPSSVAPAAAPSALPWPLPDLAHEADERVYAELPPECWIHHSR